ncbi:MAG: response regulator [Candidatus Tectomicrobia bacterium]|nr:response regulator [Candidatus Tectomicrobia bacterium]
MSTPQATLPSIALLSTDLFFATKLRAAAARLERPLRVLADAAELGGMEPPCLVLIDLETPALDIEACIEEARRHTGTAPLIAFGRHTHREQLERAKAAGCAEVLTRSDFVAQLGDILRLAGAAPSSRSGMSGEKASSS